uniref:B30.2/SPRY domain-containing protein n=1 Tax=Malurus cyaneus samueli TaxID=2593467 RepID=A0A8C5TBF8_9PASS
MKLAPKPNSFCCQVLVLFPRPQHPSNAEMEAEGVEPHSPFLGAACCSPSSPAGVPGIWCLQAATASSSSPRKGHCGRGGALRQGAAGACVFLRDSGVIRCVPSNEKRFDSHLIVLAKQGYKTGKHYWEVDAWKRKSWAVGIARESVTRKGPLTLSPQNGFWVIGLADGGDYWAYTDPWTRLSISEGLDEIGIFLDIPGKQVTFYDVCDGETLYIFSIPQGPTVSWGASGLVWLSSERGDCPALLCSAHLCSAMGQPHLECLRQFWTPQDQKDTDLI